MDKEMSVNKEDGMASKKMAKGSISRGENSKPEQTKKMAMKIMNHAQ